MNKSVQGKILCFVGPPGEHVGLQCISLLIEYIGVGKTSIGRSIARALNRKVNESTVICSVCSYVVNHDSISDSVLVV